MKRRKPGMPDRRYRTLVHEGEDVEVLGFGGPDPASLLVPARRPDRFVIHPQRGPSDVALVMPEWGNAGLAARCGFVGPVHPEQTRAIPVYVIADHPTPGAWR